MAVEELTKRLFESLGFVFLFILVWSAVLGMANPPSWNTFVAYYNQWGLTFFGDTFTPSRFFGELVDLIASVSTPNPVALQALSGGAGSIENVIDALLFFVNILTGGLLTIFISIGGLVIGIFYVLSYIVPLITAFAYFLSGSFVTNNLPGVVGQIDWSSMSGWLGYPDPVLSSA